MIIAWTRLFHAHFNNTIGDKYYYKGRNGRYILVDGERKAWELTECIKKYNVLTEPIKKNIEFFIKLRNKVEHRHIEKNEIDTLIFGECQALLYNYENKLIELFGSKYALNEALAYSLQFSHLRTPGQNRASKSALSKDIADIGSYVEKYRSSLPDDIFDTQEYSIKLLQVPKISNTNRSDAAIEFVKWDQLDEEDKELYKQIAVIIKDKKVKIEGANINRLKVTQVVKNVNKKLDSKKITTNTHTSLWKIFGVRPAYGADDPFDTNTEYCLYDEPHNDYVYLETWVNFIIQLFEINILSIDEIRTKAKLGEKLQIENYYL
ncbi:MAG: DUF3644 domain-containing protein [Candidatus Brocadiaceae bacterium]|nr:DUF3644 domain-containing protein [Candidatus Brocadiaceae bacterium]